jgi:hypothetical protein
LCCYTCCYYCYINDMIYHCLQMSSCHCDLQMFACHIEVQSGTQGHSCTTVLAIRNPPSSSCSISN